MEREIDHSGSGDIKHQAILMTGSCKASELLDYPKPNQARTQSSAFVLVALTLNNGHVKQLREARGGEWAETPPRLHHPAFHNMRLSSSFSDKGRSRRLSLPDYVWALHAPIVFLSSHVDEPERRAVVHGPTGHRPAGPEHAAPGSSVLPRRCQVCWVHSSPSTSWAPRRRWETSPAAESISRTRVLLKRTQHSPGFLSAFPSSKFSKDFRIFCSFIANPHEEVSFRIKPASATGCPAERDKAP